jgi:stage V sporulation protein D (sporulation-specific penicillin-binding protein)
MAAALDSGAIDLNTSFHCSGSEHIPGRSQLLHCWRSSGHGSEKTPQALQNSCNIAFAHIALKMGGDTFYEYIKNFGVLEKTGIDLSGESKGVFFDKAIVTDTEKWGTASLTSGSFGQTFKITPLQLVRAISAVVNGGYLVEPYIVSEVVDADENTVLKQETTVVRQVISKETSDTMRLLMQSVVEQGTAKNASAAEGIRYLRYAAMQGNAEACLMLSTCYATGKGVPKNDELMMGWLVNAAEAGNETAANLLRQAEEKKK